MKRIVYITCILSLLNAGICSAKCLSEDGQTNDEAQILSSISEDDRFENWTEEQYRQLDDSIKGKLCSNIVAHKADSASFGKDAGNLPQKSPAQRANSHVPNSVSVSTIYEVGQIVINSGTSPAGARTYEVPIDVYPGMKDFHPSLSLAYNSQQGSSVMGVGWTLSGIPTISRTGKTVYYDGTTQGAVMDNTDSFVLDGMRLIKTGTTSDCILYESEQGNIKAKGYTSSTYMKYFEVFYPDGNKGIFGYTSNQMNNLYYPLTSLTDLKGNKITYNYTSSYEHYTITGITYNGASVEFKYKSSRPDPVLYFIGGLRVYETQLLESITCRLGTSELGTYKLEYSTQNDRSLLTKISYSASGKSYNPLKFYYGNGTIYSEFSSSTTQLYEWYTADSPSKIRVAKGKFDYESGADGLIALPNLYPYYKYYRHATSLRHSENKFENLYKGDEKIFLYAGLKGDWASPMPNLVTEEGFVDILCADLEGKQEEYVIKVNNTVADNNDRVVFHVYRSNIISGLSKLYTRTFNFPTVYTDANGNKSIQPKFYYTGDFNGDGRMEVMAVSVHQPFGDTGKSSKCYIFDLVNNKIIYQGYVLPYNVEFLGTQQTDPEAAADNSDKLFAMDYDGDGKTDLCHITGTGTNVYTFDGSGSSLYPRKVASYTDLKKGDVAGRDVLPGEYNGDGLTDILVSPTSEGIDDIWTVYNSKGNGKFAKSTFSGPLKSSLDNNGFLVQDINGDGSTDLVKYSTGSFTSYLAKNNAIGSSYVFKSFPESGAILIPTNINTRNCYTQLICLKDGKATKFSFSRNDSEEAMATGMANSLGIVEKTFYGMIDEEGTSSGLYKMGAGAAFPYVNIQEPLPVVESSETYMNGSRIDINSFTYENAVIHRQGLGFRGFEKITVRNKRGQDLVRTYEPYRFSLLKSEKSPSFENTYNYSVEIGYDKIAKIRLASKYEKDLLKNISAYTSFVYDTYGYPTSETTSYTEGIMVTKTNTYSSNTTVGSGYNLGFLTDQVVKVNRKGATYSERMYIPSHSSRLPVQKFYYKDGNQVKQCSYTYDTHGNPTSETVKLFTSTNTQKTTYEYDSSGRLSKVTSPLGLTDEYTYDTNGRVASIKDHKGGTTAYTYDSFGRTTSVKNPDQTSETTKFAWSSAGTNGLYSITRSATGKPTVTEVYDALNREVRKGDKRFDGKIRNIDRLYDDYGNLQKESLPFTGSSPSYWNTYMYDSYNRMLSCTEASGKKTTYSYSGTSVTTVDSKISTTRTYDAQDNLVSVKDPAGTITYNLAADAQPVSIIAPGNVTTSFTYDKYRRRASLADPSHGTTTYEYDAAGNLSKETNANNETTQYTYDAYSRLTKTTTPEFVTTYTYNARDELTGISANNGTSKTFTYDAYGRLATWKETGVDGKWLQKDYTYSNGNVSAVKYTSQSGVLATENYYYANGHLSEAKLNGTTGVFKLSKENDLGQHTEVVTGTITRKYSFDAYGLPTGRSAANASRTFQNFSYTFDAATSNLTSRKDNTRNITESFGYDNLNRLTSFAGKTATYDLKGNITGRSDIGTFRYSLASKPYALTGAALSGSGIPTCSQDIAYNSFKRPKSITENGLSAAFTYNGDYDRVKMSVTRNGANVMTRYYLGSCYEFDQTSTSKEKLYLFGDFYDAAAVYVKEGSSGSVYYILRDYLGSITHIVNSGGTLVQELSYDAWGRLRNPANQQVYTPGQEPTPFLGRGYTGHEHLQLFGLVNMNARLYDPALGRFLSPDPFVQTPDASQNFNRYAYAMNNPLCYVDENGEFFWAAIGIGAAVGAIINVATHWKEIKAEGGWKGFWKGAGYFLAGGLAGGASTAVGMGVAMGFTSTMALTISAEEFASATMGFMAGAKVGMATGAVSGFLLDTSNALLDGESLGSALGKGVMGAGTGAFIGGLTGGIAGEIQSIKETRQLYKGSNVGLESSVAPNSSNTYFVKNEGYYVYYGVDDQGVVRYIGITKRDPFIRFAEHLRSGTNRSSLHYEIFKDTGKLTLIEARVREQIEINKFRIIKNGGTLFNLRNEISPKYWKKFGIM